MSLNPDIRDQAYQFFIEEAQELLQVLEDGLLNLRQDHSTPKVHELMRAAHSIKGGAASVELEAIKKLAHRLEDFFKALYSEKVKFDSQLESLLLQGYDCLRNPLNEQIETGSFDEELALVTAEPIFAQLEEVLGEALQEGDSYIPSATDLGVDIVSSIFEVDVAQSLEHLRAILSSPQGYDVAGELRSQIEVLGGFAELFNLPGFSEIIQLTVTALDNYPENALEITHLLVTDCGSAREVILAGDRAQGGQPSEELLALGASNSAGDHNFDSIEPDSPPLDDVFGNSDDNFFVDFATSEEENSTLSQIFGISIDSEQSHEETTEELSVSLDDVFGDNSDFSGSEVVPTVTEEAVWSSSDNLILDVATPELDDIFGDINSDSEITFPEIVSSTTLQGTTAPELLDFASPANLDAALESVTEIFDSLPAVLPVKTPELFPPNSSESKSQKKKATSKQSAQGAVSGNLSVRVDLERLERMNNLIGELVINRNSLSLQNEQLQGNVKDLMAKFGRFRALTGTLREFSDQMLVESEKSDQNSQHLTEQNLAEFDSLEMDSYSQLHLLLQGILEEIVQLEEGVDDIFLFAQQSDRTINLQRQMLGQMRDEMMWARMLPLEQIMSRFPRVLRDLSHKYQKPVNLNLIGTGVLVDKAVLEKLYDPLLHLLRNGFDHGIESPEIRQQQGKSEEGNIEIRAYYQGNQTVIEIRDDGQGLNLEKIAKKAIKQGIISAEEAKSATRERLFDLIFEPGFSTAEQVSEISGRGVGMSVVRSQIEFLKGTITVNSAQGKGSTFTLRLPLTLTIAKLLVCSLGETAFAIPSDSIEEIIIPLPQQLKLSGTQRFLFWEEKLIPIYALAEILYYNCTIAATISDSKAFESVASPEDWALPLLLLRRGQQFFALEIQKLITEQELVIKPFSKAIASPSYTYGCTILGDGTLIPVLNGATLIDEVLEESTGQPSFTSTRNLDLNLSDIEAESSQLLGSVPSPTQAVKAKTIMVVDDSTALRRTMALSLEKQGYRVIQAKDGRDAIEQFRKTDHIDLIVCDIEMPNMNGFEFLGVRRRDSTMKNVPVIMLTSRSGAKHRNLAGQLGANGYFTKPYIEQEFLKELNQILNNKEGSTNHQARIIPKTTESTTILVIDDSSALRRTMALSLENKGYRVLQAKDGKDGLEQMKQNTQIDLVVCDIEMPNMNGFEVLSSRRQDPQLRQIPVAMLTSRSSDKHRNLAQQLGADAYFTKPYVEEEFLSQIRNLIKAKTKS